MSNEAEQKRADSATIANLRRGMTASAPRITKRTIESAVIAAVIFEMGATETIEQACRWVQHGAVSIAIDRTKIPVADGGWDGQS